jgi:hypothetical protein
MMECSLRALETSNGAIICLNFPTTRVCDIATPTLNKANNSIEGTITTSWCSNWGSRPGSQCGGRQSSYAGAK